MGAKQIDGRERLERGNISAAGHDHVGLGALIVAGPFPDPDPGRAVLDRRIHVQVLQGGLLARDDHVHVISAPQTVVGDREESVGVRGEIDAHDLGLLVHDVIDEAGILMRESVVVLTPDVGGEEVVERSDRAAPGDLVVGHLEPFRVLVEHRVDDMNESLIRRKKAVAAGEEIAFQPALARVLAQDLHDAPARREIFVFGQRVRHPCAIGHLKQSVQPVRGGFVRAEDAKVPRLVIELHHVAQKSAHDSRRFRSGLAGLGYLHGVLAEIRHPQVL